MRVEQSYHVFNIKFIKFLSGVASGGNFIRQSSLSHRVYTSLIYFKKDLRIQIIVVGLKSQDSSYKDDNAQET